jgi:hypothetical protein
LKQPARATASLITLLAATSLTVTACGSASDSGGKGTIHGAQPPSRSAPPTPSSTDDGIARPKITFPAGVKHVFEDGNTGDPTQDAVLYDNEQNILAEDDAILRGDPGSTALKFYNTGTALAGAIDWVKRYIDADLSFTGTIRYVNRQVTLDGSDKASLTYCGDESKAYNTNRKTGKVQKTAPSADSYVFYNSRLAKNSQGIWQTTDLVSSRGDKKCQP